MGNQVKHGNSRRGQLTSEYVIWKSMLARCHNPSQQAYKNYGARGITVCERWLIFQNFLDDMGERPKGHQIERKDNNKGYSKDNCVWETVYNQSRNRRSNIIVLWENNIMPLKDAAEHFKLPYKTVHMRIKRGWTVAEALTSPVEYRGQSHRKAA